MDWEDVSSKEKRKRKGIKKTLIYVTKLLRTDFAPGLGLAQRWSFWEHSSFLTAFLHREINQERREDVRTVPWNDKNKSG